MIEIFNLLKQLLTALPDGLVDIINFSLLFYFYKMWMKDRETFNERVKSATHDQYMMTLRASIVNESLPRSVRLEIYDEYKKEGGNSWVSQYVDEHLLTDELVTDIRKFNRRITDNKNDQNSLNE